MEMKFYEKIGVRKWKNFMLWLMGLVCRNPEVMRKVENYYLSGINIMAVKNFRKMLVFNGVVHFLGILACIEGFVLIMMQNNLVSFQTLEMTVLFFLHLYCTMLQRYNWIRIKKVLKKVTRK